MSVIVDGKLKLTYQEYRHFPEDGNRHELIDGEHYMASAPGTGHQSISRHIHFQLYRQIEEEGLGQVFNAPTDVQLSEIDIVQPDLMVILRENEHTISPSRIIGSPDLVVEITSPSTAQRDQELKRMLYEKRGVPVYWLVDPDAQEVTVWEAGADGRYDKAGHYHDEVTFTRGAVRATVDLTSVW